MKKAFNKLGLEQPYVFFENEKEMGDMTLLKFCSKYSEVPRNNKLTCIFDRDNAEISKEHKETIKNWDNNVFSFMIPLPSHRNEYDEISIEHYFSDEELKRIDSFGRRLFLGNEFDTITGVSNCTKYISIDRKKCKKDSIKIIDTKVFQIGDSTNNLTLSMNDFTKYLLEDKLEYDFNKSAERVIQPKF